MLENTPVRSLCPPCNELNKVAVAQRDMERAMLGIRLQNMNFDIPDSGP